jgi:predicted RNase H-like HicB family nuclease
MKTFKVIVEQDEDGTYIVDCPTFKGCHSYGENMDEALENIKDVIEMCVEEAIEEGEQFDFPKIIDLKEVQVAV